MHWGFFGLGLARSLRKLDNNAVYFDILDWRGCLRNWKNHLKVIVVFSPRSLLASAMSLGMIVTRLAWMAHKLASSNRPIRYASAAVCMANRAVDWKRTARNSLSSVWMKVKAYGRLYSLGLARAPVFGKASSWSVILYPFGTFVSHANRRYQVCTVEVFWPAVE